MSRKEDIKSLDQYGRIRVNQSIIFEFMILLFFATIIIIIVYSEIVFNILGFKIVTSIYLLVFVFTLWYFEKHRDELIKQLKDVKNKD